MGPRLRVLALAAVCLCLAGPAAAGSGGGLFGVVHRSPTTPVCHAEMPCGKPAAGAVLVFVRRGRSWHTKTHADGSYRLALPAGTYRVRLGSTGRARFGSLVKLALVTVTQAFTRRNLTIDTGIR